MTSNLKSDAIKKLRVVLEESNIYLLKSDDHFELIVDTGCSKAVTPHLTDFVFGSLTNLYEPMTMDGIAGLLFSTKKCRFQ